MKNFFTLSIIIVLATIDIAFAQRTIRGTVTKAGDNSEISDASVMIKGTTLSVRTNIVGKYSINTPPGPVTLIFQAQGMRKKEIIIGTSLEINVKLTPIDANIGIVSITALNIKKDAKKLPFAASNTNRIHYERHPTTNAINSMKGNTAGATISSTSEISSSSVIVRGYSSISGNNNPLYVVDGVPIDHNLKMHHYNGHDFGSNDININPANIENLSLLKGAAATAQYGSRGANGVVMIETKQGNTQDFTIEYCGTVSSLEPLRIPQLQNTFGYPATYLSEGIAGSWGPVFDGKNHKWDNSNSDKEITYAPANNNLYNFYEKGRGYTNSINMGSGDGNNSFFVSYLNKKTNGILPGLTDKNNKHLFSINSSRSTHKIRMNTSVHFAHNNGKQISSNTDEGIAASHLYTSLLQFPRNIEIANYKNYETDSMLYAGNTNPYYIINNHQLDFIENNLWGGVSIDYKLFEHLTASYRAGVNTTDLSFLRHDKTQTTISDFSGLQQNQLSTTQDFLLTGKLQFDELSLVSFAGLNSLQNNFKQQNGINNNDSFKYKTTTLAYFGQSEINYSNYGMATVLARGEKIKSPAGISKTVFYPAVSTAIFIQNIAGLSEKYTDQLKVRAAWGKTGNTLLPHHFMIAKESIEPEVTTETEAGIDFAMPNNLLYLNITYYNRISKNLLLTNALNSGKIQNKGIELSAIFATPQTAYVQWEVLINFTKNNNIVLELAENLTETILYTANNVEMVAIEGQPLGTFRTPDFLKTTDGKLIVNPQNGFPIPSDSKKEIGNIQPDYILGLTNTIKYKDLELSFTFDYRAGGSFYSGTANVLYNAGNATKTTFNERRPFVISNSVIAIETAKDDQIQYIENNNPVATDDMAKFYNATYNKTAAKDRILSRSYLKFRHLSVVYNIPSHLTKLINCKGLQLMFIANNLMLFTPDDNNFVDPETSSLGNDLTGAFGELNTMPSIRSYTAGLRINF